MSEGWGETGETAGAQEEGVEETARFAAGEGGLGRTAGSGFFFRVVVAAAAMAMAVLLVTMLGEDF